MLCQISESDCFSLSEIEKLDPIVLKNNAVFMCSIMYVEVGEEK